MTPELKAYIKNEEITRRKKREERREERLGEKREWEEVKQGKSTVIQAEETKCTQA